MASRFLSNYVQFQLNYILEVSLVLGGMLSSAGALLPSNALSSSAPSVCGLRSISNSVYYPLRMVCSNPANLENVPCEIVTTAKQDGGEVFGASATDITPYVSVVDPVAEMGLLDRLGRLFAKVQMGSMNPLITSSNYRAVIEHVFPAGLGRDNKALVDSLCGVFNSVSGGTLYKGHQVCMSRTLLTALTCLSSLPRRSKLLASFALYAGAKGYMTLMDMEEYLRDLFLVMLRTSKGSNSGMNAFEENNVTIEEVARATAEGAIGGGDRLTFMQFERWFKHGGNGAFAGLQDGNAAKLALSGLPQQGLLYREYTVQEAMKLTGLCNCDVSVIMDAAKAMERSGYMSWLDFMAFMSTVHSPCEGDGQQAERDDLIRRIFCGLNDGKPVQGRVVRSSLAVLCRGQTTDAKALCSFNNFADGEPPSVTLFEFSKYLSTVFMVLSQLSPSSMPRGVTPRDLAETTAKDAFEDIGLGGADRMYQDDFVLWYSKSSFGAKENAGNALESSCTADFYSSSGRDSDAMAVSRLTSQSIREATGIHRVPVQSLFEIFAEVSDEDGMVSRSSFHLCFELIVDAQGWAKDELEDRLKLATIVVDRLFDVFESSASTPPFLVSFDEIASGLSILAAGSQEEKVRASFDLYDIDDDGYINLEAMKTYLSSVFRVLFEINPEVERLWGEEMGVSPDQLGHSTAEEAFKSSNLGEDGRLSFEEFKMWYSRSGSVIRSKFKTTSATAEEYDPENYDLDSGGLHPVTMEEVQKITGLEDQHVEDIFELFATHADDEGFVTKESFFECFALLVKGRIEALEETDRARILFVVDSLFHALDVNDDGKLDYCELASGISVLCGGVRDEKVRAAFSLFDLNGDGYISLDEMATYLCSMFRMLYKVKPEIQDNVGSGPVELAIQTAKQAFADNDVNNDGRLSFEEFTNWYMTEEVAGVEQDIRKAATITRDELRRLTTFKQRLPEDVFDILANYTDVRGMLSRESFHQGMKHFVISSDAEHYQAMAGFIAHLSDEIFDAFSLEEFAGQEEMVDFSEVCSGLSVLCAGSKQRRVSSALKLFDVEGHGKISLEDLKIYLAAAYKLLFWIEPTLAQEYDVEAQQLGLITAMECFESVGVGGGEGVTLEAFLKWCIDGEESEARESEEVEEEEVAQREKGDKDGGGDGKGDAQEVLIEEQGRSLQAIREITKVHHFNIGEVMKQLADRTDIDGLIDISGLYEFFVTLNRAFGREFDYNDLSINRKLKDFTLGFFGLFDAVVGKDHGVAKRVRFSEVACALTILCGGEREEKVNTSFQLFDSDEDGFLSEHELALLMGSVFNLMKMTDPAIFEKLNLSPKQLAIVTARSTFSDASLVKGLIGIEEFKKWYNSPAVVGDDTYMEGFEDQSGAFMGKTNHGGEAYGGDFEESSIKVQLKSKQKLLGFDAITVDDLLDILSESAPEGKLTKEAFLKCIQNVKALGGAAESGKELDDAMTLGSNIFDSFHQSGGKVDFAELTSGLSVLCSGSPRDKIITTFTIHDSDADGNLSLEETTHFITNVFKVLYECCTNLKGGLGVGACELVSRSSNGRVRFPSCE